MEEKLIDATQTINSLLTGILFTVAFIGLMSLPCYSIYYMYSILWYYNYYIIITVYYIIWYIETVIVPYVTRVHSELKNEKQAALTIFDCFKSQLTKEPPMLWKTTIYPQ